MITLITKYLVDHLEDSQDELWITSDDPVPTAISGEVARRDDVCNAHKEADVIIVNENIPVVCGV